METITGVGEVGPNHTQKSSSHKGPSSKTHITVTTLDLTLPLQQYASQEIFIKIK